MYKYKYIIMSEIVSSGYDVRLFLSNPDLTVGLAGFAGSMYSNNRFDESNRPFGTLYMRFVNSWVTLFGAVVIHDCLPEKFQWLPSLAIIAYGTYRAHAYIQDIALGPRIRRVDGVRTS